MEDTRTGKFSYLSSYGEIENCRAQGAQIGKNVQIGQGAILYYTNANDIMIGDNVNIGKQSRLMFGKLIIGDNVTFGEDVDIRSNVISIGENSAIGNNLRALVPDAFVIGQNSNVGDNNRVTCREFQAKEFLQFYSNVTVGEGGRYGVNSRVMIGSGCFIGAGCVLNCSEEVTIGHDVGIGQQCMIWTHGGYLSTLDGFPASFAPVTIGSHVWIPARTIILPGITIGSYVVIGINSLINKDVPSNCLAGGIPVKILRENCYPKKLSQEEKNILIMGIIKRYIPLMEDKVIKGTVSYDAKTDRIILKRQSGKTFYNIGSMKIEGIIDEESEDFRDFLRRNGIKFFTNTRFKSIIPPVFKKFMDV